MIAKIVVPWRPGDPAREANWLYAQAWWLRFGYELLIVEHKGDDPFSRAWCINEGARRAWPWDVLLMIDADVVEDQDWQVTNTVITAWETGALVVGHTEGRDLTEKGTKWVLDHHPFDWNTQVAARRPECLSRVNAMRSDLFERLGGLDERFSGYGHEDTSLYAASRALAEIRMVPGNSWHLYHEPMLPKSRPTPEWQAGKELALRYLDAEKQGWPAVLSVLEERTPEEKYVPPFPTPMPELEHAVVDLVVMTSGRREYLEQTLASAAEHLKGEIASRIMFDDSGDPAFAEYLDRTYGYFGRPYPEFTIIHHETNLGYSIAMKRAREWVRDHEGSPFVFWLEDDFTFGRDISLDEMATLLTNEDLAQVVLLRQAWKAEIAAGGIVQQHPESYEWTTYRGTRYLQHQAFFSSNPHLARRELFDIPWPEGNHTESHFGHILTGVAKNTCARCKAEGVLDANGNAHHMVFSFLGWNEQTVTHIGEVRGGHGY